MTPPSAPPHPGATGTGAWAFTGGQASVVRAFAGVSGAACALSGLPGDTALGAAILVLGGIAGLALAVGWRSRIAAVVLACVLARQMGHGAAPGDVRPVLVVAVFLAHAALPPAPFGSLAARGRIDPRGGWRFPRPLFVAAWVVLAAAYGFSGWTKLGSPSWRDGSALERVLANPLAGDTALGPLLRAATWGALALQLAFPLLALAGPTRRLAWIAMTGVHAGLLVTVDSTGRTLGMLVVHAFTFDPSWVPRRDADAPPDTLFYDGGCGLCHRSVRFFLAEDADGRALRYAPLGGDTFRDLVLTRSDGRAPEPLPDSLVLRTHDGRVLVRSDAVVTALARLGGLWRVASVLLRAVPRPLRDAAYDGIARVRLRLFAKPADTCPVLPPDLRARFSA